MRKEHLIWNFKTSVISLKIEIFDTLKLDFDADRGDLELSFIANGYGREKKIFKN